MKGLLILGAILLVAIFAPIPQPLSFALIAFTLFGFAFTQRRRLRK